MNLPALKDAFYRSALAFCALFVILLSCRRPSLPEENAAQVLSAPPPGAAPEKGRLILEDGNFWTTGVPGFGENALPAFFGSYRFVPEGSAGQEREGGGLTAGLRQSEGPSQVNSAGMGVWLCREILYYDAWQELPGLSSGQWMALEKQNGEDLLIAAEFTDVWTAVFSFQAETAPGLEDINRIINIYRSRFLYFLAQSKRDSDISLPALIDF